MTEKVTKYTFGQKEYRPKADHNKRSWEKLSKAVSKKGGATMAEMRAALNYKWKDDEGKEHEMAHEKFVNYMLRNQHIAEAK